MPAINSQVEDIHAMLPSGEESIRVEPHTLIILGLAGFFIIFVNNLIITQNLIEDYWQQQLLEALIYVVAILTAGIIDYRITQRLYIQRDESLSFVHRQIRKVIYLIVGLVVIYIMGATFLGGGRVNEFIVWALFGLTFCVYGLFSEKLLSWFGVFCIAMGYLSDLLKIPPDARTYIELSILGIGLPALAWVLSRPSLHKNISRRLLLSCSWILLVTMPAFVVYQIVIAFQTSPVPHAPNVPIVSLSEYQKQTTSKGKQIVSLPIGTVIPIHFHLQGDTFDDMKTSTTSPITLSQPLYLLVENEKPGPWYRIDQDEWKHRQTIRFQNEWQLSPPDYSRDEGVYFNLKTYFVAN